MGTPEKNLSVIHGGAMPVLNVSNEQKLSAIRDTVAKGASDAEFTMLMHLANTYKLDPFLKEIWFIKYGSTPTIMVSRDGLRNYAMRQEDFLGMMSQEVRQGDTFKFNPITGEIHHEIGDGSGPITKCYAIIKREGKPDHTEIIDFKEYYDALSGKNAVWKTHPSAMGKKTVEVLALKKCYTITGLYAPEEMGLQESDAIVPEYSYVDDKRRPEPARPAFDKDAWLAALNSLNDLAESLGVNPDQVKALAHTEFGKGDPKTWSMHDIKHLTDYLKKYQAADAETEATVDDGPHEDADGLPTDDDLPF
jgi:phage recombination protein Bet